MEERYDPMEWKYDRMEERYDPMEHGYDPMECKSRLDCIFVQNAPPYIRGWRGETDNSTSCCTKRKVPVRGIWTGHLILIYTYYCKMEAMLLFFYIYLALFASIALAEFQNKFYLEARYWGTSYHVNKRITKFDVFLTNMSKCTKAFSSVSLCISAILSWFQYVV